MPQSYPMPVFHFEVDWEGTRIGFTEITGLKVTTGVIEYREGVNPEYHVQKMPGMQKFETLTMKRGIFKTDNEFYEWWNTVALNTIQRRDITVQLLDENHDPVMIWNIKNAWPTSVEGPGLNAKSDEVAIETLTVAFESLSIKLP
jgi:phage tail-like protein